MGAIVNTGVASGSQPVTVISLPLPPNAAQETGGNLASIASTNLSLVATNEILREIVAQLQLLNMNFASCAPSAHTSLDNIQMDSFTGVN